MAKFNFVPSFLFGKRTAGAVKIEGKIQRIASSVTTFKDRKTGAKGPDTQYHIVVGKKPYRSDAETEQAAYLATASKGDIITFLAKPGGLVKEVIEIEYREAGPSISIIDLLRFLGRLFSTDYR